MIHSRADALATLTENFLLISGDFVRTGGMDIANFHLADYIAQKGIPVNIVAHEVDPALASLPNVKWQRAPRPRHSTIIGEPLLRRLGYRTARCLRPSRPHIVVNGGNCPLPDVNWVHYVHAAVRPVCGGGLLRRAKTRLAHRLYLRGEERALRTARLIIANSLRTKKDLVAHYELDPATIYPVYYGINPSDFYPADSQEKDRTRSELGLPRDRCIITFIGALGDRRKGFDILFQAWKSLSRELTGVATLLVIGTGAELSNWQQNAAKELPLGEIRFLGFRRDVPAIMRACDGFVAPTRYEAFGLAVQEALCCGLPAIVSRDAGVAELYPLPIQPLLLDNPECALQVKSLLMEIIRRNAYWKDMMKPVAHVLRQRTWNTMAHEIFTLITTPEALL